MNDTYSDTKTKNTEGNIREQRMVSGFTRISVSGDATLQVAQGDREWLIVEAPEELISQVVTEVNSGTLNLHLEGNFSRSVTKRRIHFFVGCKNLDAVSLSGSTAVRIPTLTTPKFLCDASGSALLEIGALETKHLKVDASGSATLTIAGHADQQTLDSSGALSYRGSQLQTRQTQIDVSGAGDLTLWVEELLDARAVSGMCRVRYYGNPLVKQERNFMTKLVAMGEPQPQGAKTE